MIDPRMPGNCERKSVLAGKLVVLEEVLCVPHMPPNVRIVHIRAVRAKNELDSNQNQDEHGKEGRSCPKPTLRARAEIKRVTLEGSP